MKRMTRVLMVVGCLAVLLLSWAVTLGAKSDKERQVELMEQAATYLEDEVYILAVPLLEEAAGYSTDYTWQAEETLKQAYLALNDIGYRNKYEDLLGEQTLRADADEAVFLEAVNYYLEQNDRDQVYEILYRGIKQTDSTVLNNLYEEIRYEFEIGRNTYQDVTTAYNGAIQVMRDGQWGLAQSDGTSVIPCEYDKVSTYSGGCAVVNKDGVIYAIDGSNFRVALYRGEATDFGNLAENRIAVKYGDGWGLVTSEFYSGGNQFDEIGMFAEGYAPAKFNGKWGLLTNDGESWELEPEYDNIIRDKLGRAFCNGTLFVQIGEKVYLQNKDGRGSVAYEDARPFADGWAAVKKNGKWGFIDREENVQIDFRFEDALSFGQHLAAVKVDGRWGYISRTGKMVIEPIFEAAESFYDGSAPVKTADGWHFISLLEYQ